MNISSFYINKKNKFFQTAMLFFIVSILTYFIVFSKSNFEIVSNIVVIFIKIIVPSLFPFILFSNLLIFSGYSNIICDSSITKVIQKFLKISKYSASSVIFGFIFGYPNGARYINQMYEEKKLSFKEAEYLLLFTNNASPIYILSSIGIGMFSNIKIGILLLLSHIISSLLIGKIYSYKYRDLEESKMKCGFDNTNFSFDTIYLSIKRTFSTLGIIFGFMVIFVMLNGYITKIFNYILPINTTFKYILLCMMEISTGLNSFIELNFNLKLTLTAISFFLGFSSLSIIFQIFCTVYTNKFKLKNILKGKLMHGIFSSVITYILVNIPKVYEVLNIAKNVNLNINNLFKSSYSFRQELVFDIILFSILIILFLIGIKKEMIKKTLIISKGG